MRFVLVGDCHYSVRSPENRKDVYHEAIRDKLLQCIELAKDATALVQLGDLTHLKSKCHWRDVADLIDILKTCTVPVVAIPGNHDLIAGRFDSYRDLPVGILEKAGVLKVPYPSLEFKEGSHTVELVCMPFNYTLKPEMFPQTPVPANTTRVVLCHQSLMLAPPPFPMEITTYDTAASWNKNWNVLVSGHLHECDDVKWYPDGRLILNTGAICRAVLNLDHADRKVRVPILDIDNGKITLSWHQLAVKPLSAIFDVESYVKKKHSEQVFENFTDELSKEAAIVKTQDLRSLITTLPEFGSLTEVERSLIRQYLATVEV